MEIGHPSAKQGYFFQFQFSHLAGWSGNTNVGYRDIKQTAVIADIEYGGIFRYIFFSFDNDLGACQPKGNAEGPQNNGQGTFIF